MRWATLYRRIGKAVTAASWFVFPVVPLLAENLYDGLTNLNFQPNAPSGPDPHDWGASQWVILTAPLVGYGFLAGATWGIGDEAGGRWWRRWATRRSVWVGLGAWFGLWTLGLALATLWATHWLAGATLGADRLTRWEATLTPGPAVAGVLGWAMAAWLCLGWLPVAWAALRRARHVRRLGPAWRVGLGLGCGFAGSLFGGFWLITTAWRDYYFDPTIVP